VSDSIPTGPLGEKIKGGNTPQSLRTLRKRGCSSYINSGPLHSLLREGGTTWAHFTFEEAERWKSISQWGSDAPLTHRPGPQPRVKSRKWVLV
jgi:hypothetical protein